MTRYRRALIDGGVFFFTVTLSDRSSNLLVREIDRLRSAYAAVKNKYPFETVAICVLPEHLHALWSLPAGDADFSLRWNLIKRNFSSGLAVRADRSSSKIARREKGIWQRRFWEHAIRNDADLEKHVDYIHFNPVKHRHVGRTKDWEYSSFHRMVRLGVYPEDWGGDRRDDGASFGER
jgi:putative transposase